MEKEITKITKTIATSSRDVSASLNVKAELSWLNNDLESEVLSNFQPLYGHKLTRVEIENIADTLANTAELWIKFNWRITHV
ncbi:MAG: hypothetical protein NTY75_00280 [Candidatus Shapirobacteria bacterium]|nr:hypothetical protein [Candidatus Shapirobacteria bacterium]